MGCGRSVEFARAWDGILQSMTRCWRHWIRWRLMTTQKVDVARILIFFTRGGELLNGGSDRAQTFRVDGWGPQRMGFYKGGPRIHQNGLRRTVFEIGPLLDFQRFLDAKGAAPGDWGVTKHYGNGYSRVLLPFATGFKTLGPLGAKIFDFWRRVPHVTAPFRSKVVLRVSTLRKIPANRDT